jgi:hypothetical protein
MWSARQRSCYSVDGESEDGDGASEDDVGVWVPRHGPATNYHVSCGAVVLLHLAVGMETSSSIHLA